MSVTLQELIDEYVSTGHLDSVPSEEGIYKVILPNNLDVIFHSYSEAKKCDKDPYSVEELQTKWLRISECNYDDKNILYIGKAVNLRKRIKQLLRFGIGQVKNHVGGRALWQIDNNKRLLLEYEVVGNSRLNEKEMLIDYKNRYGVYPLANYKC